MKKKILYLTYEDVFTHGVLQAMVVLPIVEMSKLKSNYNFEIISFSRKDDRLSYTYKKNKSQLLPENIRINEFLKFGSTKSRGLIAIINLIYGYLRVVFKVFSADVIHIRSYAFIPFAILARLMSKRIVWDPRGILSLEIEDIDGSKSFTTRLLFYFEKIALRYSDSIVCVSEKMKDYFLNRYSNKMVVIPNPTNHKNYNPLKNREIINIVYSGRLLKWHSKNSILICYEALQKYNKEFVFNLLTPDIEVAFGLFEGKKINPKNLIIKTCSSNEIISFLDQAHIGICLIEPSKSKRYCAPVKFAEYLAAKMLVLGNLHIGDVSDYILETGNGEVIDNLKPESIEKGLIKLVEKIENGYTFNNTSLEKFTWEWNINNLISLYE